MSWVAKKPLGTLIGKSTEDIIEATLEQPSQRKFFGYMSWNPNKPLHVGHARNVCIGDTLRRVYTELWYNIQTSHYGDDSGVNVWYNIVGHLSYDIPLEPPVGKSLIIIVRWSLSANEGRMMIQISRKTLPNVHAIETNSDTQITQLHKEYVKKCTIEQLRSCRRIGASFNMINRETDASFELVWRSIGVAENPWSCQVRRWGFLAEKSKTKLKKTMTKVWWKSSLMQNDAG